jgi:hypothetical protein
MRGSRLVVALVSLRERLLDAPIGAMPAPRPDELFLCTACILAGIPTLLGAPPQSIVEAVLWWPLRYVWAGSLTLWPAIVIWTSLARWMGRNQVNAAIVHRFASILLAWTCIAYGVAVLAVGGWGAAVAAGFVLAFAVMRLWRAYEMRRWLIRNAQ